MAVPHDALWHLDNFNPVVDDYKLGTELNKAQADLTTLNARLHGNAVLDVAAGLVIGTNDLTIKIANAFHYTIAGGMYLKGATDNIALSGATGLACAVSKFAAYVITVNATGAIALIKAADATSAALALAAVNAVTLPNTIAPVGIIHVQNSGGAIFTPGATGAGLGDFADDTTADTYIDFVGVSHEALGVVPTLTFATIT
ncbi:hypothetical protein LCGC14_1928730 [marine sediment metagenome]|uniref:Uncharacterized protein n=1 Tax=marine sediment metagenome TaxID=412755 RepID=A0A0F9I2I5_9ZZZZ